MHLSESHQQLSKYLRKHILLCCLEDNVNIARCCCQSMLIGCRQGDSFVCCTQALSNHIDQRLRELTERPRNIGSMWWLTAANTCIQTSFRCCSSKLCSKFSVCALFKRQCEPDNDLYLSRGRNLDFPSTKLLSRMACISLRQKCRATVPCSGSRNAPADGGSHGHEARGRLRYLPGQD